MPRKIEPKKCKCGCGEMTRGGLYVRGHDQRHVARVIKMGGGIDNVEMIINDYYYREGKTNDN